MKNYIIVIFLVFVSCEKVFHEEETGYIRLESEQEKRDFLKGIYGNLAQVFSYDYFKLLCRADDVNYYTAVNFSDHNGIECISGSNNFLKGVSEEIYLNCYQVILSINSMVIQLNAEKDRALIGELYFLRAYTYFKLARLFGRPPLVTDIDVDFLIERPSYTQVYELIEEDMLRAISLLPETNSEARIPGESPHVGTAKAMLAEIYLAMAGFPVNDESKYAKAAQLAGEAIERAEVYNFKLSTDFAKLWMDKYRHNDEIIFGLFFLAESNETNNLVGSVTDVSITNSRYYDEEYDMFFDNKQISIHSDYQPEFAFFREFPNNYRKRFTMVLGRYANEVYHGEDTLIYNLIFTPFDPVIDPCKYLDEASYLKWFDFSLAASNTSYRPVRSTNTLYLLRYAQTLLTYAEAKARVGELDISAYEALNKVRRRANHLELESPSVFDLQTGLSESQFIDSVIQERAWELAMEPEGRWFDIIRLNMRNTLESLRLPNDYPTEIPAIYLTSDWYFYKLPEADRLLNPNLEE